MENGESKAVLIPDGAEVIGRLTGCERVVFSFVEPAVLYKLTFQVTEGPHAGARVSGELWHSPSGFRRLAADMAALGCVHPEELCGTLRGEYRVRVGVAVKADRDGTAVNRVDWLESLTTAEQWYEVGAV